MKFGQNPQRIPVMKFIFSDLGGFYAEISLKTELLDKCFSRFVIKKFKKHIFQNISEKLLAKVQHVVFLIFKMCFVSLVDISFYLCIKRIALLLEL